MSSQKCYACDSPKTSVEHVPPRCLFPEKKDLPPGVDLRKQLITVPSCDAHNSAKSHDDEYLLFALVMNLPNNVVGANHFLTKVMRAIAKNPKKIQRFTNTTVPVLVKDETTGNIEKTIAVRVEFQRLKRTLAMIGRATYFHHFGQRWDGKVSVHPHFTLALTEPNARDLNDALYGLATSSEESFKTEPRHGQNQKVFFYQVATCDQRSGAIMLLHFYEGARVTLLFGENG